MNLFNYLMARKGHNTSPRDDLFAYLLGKIPKVVKEVTGVTIHITDVSKKKIISLWLDKESSQDGTPTPDNPIPVEVVEGYENLFDKDNANIINCLINGTTKVISNYYDAKTLYIPINSGLTYTIYKKVSQRFAVGSCSSIPSNNVICSVVIQDNSSNKITITTNENDNYLAVFYYLNGVDTLAEQEILNSIMITEGTSEHPYVPYGNNYVDVKVTGKNLIPQTQTGIYTVNNVTITTNNDGSITLNGTSNDRYSYIYINNGYWSSQSDDTDGRFKVKANTNYTLKGTDNSNVRFRIRNITDGTNDSNTSSNYTFSYSNDKNIIIMLYIYPNATFNNVVLYPQLEQGSATPYEPYKESIVPIPLNGNFIGGKGDYLDELIVDKFGKCYLNKVFNKVVLDGVNNLFTGVGSTNTTGVHRFMTADIGSKLSTSSTQVIPAFCNRLISKSLDDTYVKREGFSFSNSTHKISIYIDEISTYTLEQANEWLLTHNLELYYPLAQEDLIDLHYTIDLKLFIGENNISNSEDMMMTLKYY